MAKNREKASSTYSKSFNVEREKAHRFLISTINTRYPGKKSSLTVLLHTIGNSPLASVEDKVQKPPQIPSLAVPYIKWHNIYT